MGGGQRVELKMLMTVVEETAKLVEGGSWKVRFGDAFVYQFRKRMLDWAFSGAIHRFFASLM